MAQVPKKDWVSLDKVSKKNLKVWSKSLNSNSGDNGSVKNLSKKKAPWRLSSGKTAVEKKSKFQSVLEENKESIDKITNSPFALRNISSTIKNIPDNVSNFITDVKNISDTTFWTDVPEISDWWEQIRPTKQINDKGIEMVARNANLIESIDKVWFNILEATQEIHNNKDLTEEEKKQKVLQTNRFVWNRLQEYYQDVFFESEDHKKKMEQIYFRLQSWQITDEEATQQIQAQELYYKNTVFPRFKDAMNAWWILTNVWNFLSSWSFSKTKITDEDKEKLTANDLYNLHLVWAAWIIWQSEEAERLSPLIEKEYDRLAQETPSFFKPMTQEWQNEREEILQWLWDINSQKNKASQIVINDFEQWRYLTNALWWTIEFNKSALLNKTIPRFFDWRENRYIELSTYQSRLNNIVDDWSKDRPALQSQYKKISSEINRFKSFLENDYDDFVNYYVSNVGKDWFRDIDSVIEWYEKDFWKDIKDIFSVTPWSDWIRFRANEWLWVLLDSFALAKAQSDIIDEWYFSNVNVQWALTAWVTTVSLVSRFSTKLFNSVINVWQNLAWVDDDFSDIQMSAYKNILDSIDNNNSTDSIISFARNAELVVPEIATFFTVNAWVWWLATRWSAAISNAWRATLLAWKVAWSTKYVRSVSNWMNNFLSRITPSMLKWLRIPAWLIDEAVVYSKTADNIVSAMKSWTVKWTNDLLNLFSRIPQVTRFWKKIMQSFGNAYFTGIVWWSWFFEKFDPEWYTNEDFLMDIYFWAAEIAFDVSSTLKLATLGKWVASWKWISGWRSIMQNENISRYITNTDFREKFTRSFFSFEPKERTELTKQQMQTYETVALNILNDAWSSLRTIKNWDPNVNNVDRILWIKSALRNSENPEEVAKQFEDWSFFQSFFGREWWPSIRDVNISDEVLNAFPKSIISDSKRIVKKDISSPWYINTQKLWDKILFYWDWLTFARTWDQEIDKLIKDYFDAKNYEDFWKDFEWAATKETRWLRSSNEIANDLRNKWVDIDVDSFDLYSDIEVEELKNSIIKWDQSLTIWWEQLSSDDLITIFDLDKTPVFRMEKITWDILSDYFVQAYYNTRRVFETTTNISDKTVWKEWMSWVILDDLWVIVWDTRPDFSSLLSKYWNDPLRQRIAGTYNHIRDILYNLWSIPDKGRNWLSLTRKLGDKWTSIEQYIVSRVASDIESGNQLLLWLINDWRYEEVFSTLVQSDEILKKELMWFIPSISNQKQLIDSWMFSKWEIDSIQRVQIEWYLWIKSDIPWDVESIIKAKSIDIIIKQNPWLSRSDAEKILSWVSDITYSSIVKASDKEFARKTASINVLSRRWQVRETSWTFVDEVRTDIVDNPNATVSEKLDAINRYQRARSEIQNLVRFKNRLESESTLSNSISNMSRATWDLLSSISNSKPRTWWRSWKIISWDLKKALFMSYKKKWKLSKTWSSVREALVSAWLNDGQLSSIKKFILDNPSSDWVDALNSVLWDIKVPLNGADKAKLLQADKRIAELSEIRQPPKSFYDDIEKINWKSISKSQTTIDSENNQFLDPYIWVNWQKFSQESFVEIKDPNESILWKRWMRTIVGILWERYRKAATLFQVAIWTHTIDWKSLGKSIFKIATQDKWEYYESVARFASDLLHSDWIYKYAQSNQYNKLLRSLSKNIDYDINFFAQLDDYKQKLSKNVLDRYIEAVTNDDFTNLDKSAIDSIHQQLLSFRRHMSEVWHILHWSPAAELVKEGVLEPMSWVASFSDFFRTVDKQQFDFLTNSSNQQAFEQFFWVSELNLRTYDKALTALTGKSDMASFIDGMAAIMWKNAWRFAYKVMFRRMPQIRAFSVMVNSPFMIVANIAWVLGMTHKNTLNAMSNSEARRIRDKYNILKKPKYYEWINDWTRWDVFFDWTWPWMISSLKKMTNIPGEIMRSSIKNWQYTWAEIIFDNRIANRAVAEAVGRKFDNFTQFDNFVSRLWEDEKTRFLTEMLLDADTIYKASSWFYFDQALSRMVFSNTSSIPSLRAAKSLYMFSWNFLTSRWRAHLTNYVRMFWNNQKFVRSEYNRVLESKWLTAANNYVNTIMRWNLHTEYMLAKMIWMFSFANKASRVTGEEGDVSYMSTRDMVELLFNPIQWVSSSAEWRVLLTALQSVLWDSRYSYDNNIFLSTWLKTATQFLRELSKWLSYHSAVVWELIEFSRSPSDYDFERFSYSLTEATNWYHRFVSNDIQRDWLTVNSVRTPTNVLSHYMPWFNNEKDYLFNLSAEKRVFEVIEHMKKWNFEPIWNKMLSYAMPRSKRDFPKTHRESNLINEIIDNEDFQKFAFWNDMTPFNKNVSLTSFYQLTDNALRKTNDDVSWAWDIIRRRFSNLNYDSWDTMLEKVLNSPDIARNEFNWTKENNFFNLAIKWLEDWQYDVIYDQFAKTDDIWVKQNAFILTYLESDEPWSGIQLLQAIAAQKEYDVANEIASSLWLKSVNDIPKEIRDASRAKVWEDYLPYLKIADKERFSVVSLRQAYEAIGWENSEYADMFVTPSAREGQNPEDVEKNKWIWFKSRWWWDVKSKEQQTQNRALMRRFQIKLMAMVEMWAGNPDAFRMDNAFATMFAWSSRDTDIEKQADLIGIMDSVSYIQWSDLREDEKNESVAWILAWSVKYITSLINDQEFFANNWPLLDRVYSMIYGSWWDMLWLSDQISYDKEVKEKMDVELIDWLNSVISSNDWKKSKYSLPYWSSFGWSSSVYAKVKNFVRDNSMKFSQPKPVANIDTPNYDKFEKALLRVNAILRDVRWEDIERWTIQWAKFKRDRPSRQSDKRAKKLKSRDTR